MPDLKLIALDTEGLSVISAHLQDAIVRVSDMAFLPREGRFAVVANRFDWAEALGVADMSRPGNKLFERRRTGLRFERVLGAKVHGFNIGDKSAALALLAVTFEPSSEPETVEGHVTLTFSGGAAIRLHVECLEVEMRDLGAAWAARRPPNHSEAKES